jgi:hypothetical protein
MITAPPWEYGLPEGRVTPSPSVDRLPTRKSTRDERGRPSSPPISSSSTAHSLYLSKKKKRRMIVTSLRRGLLRTHAPHRRLPFSTSTSLSSSSSSSASASTSAAQKKAQDALGNVSAALMRAGTYARSALGPFGARFSGLLGCSSTLLSLCLPYPFLY